MFGTQQRRDFLIGIKVSETERQLIDAAAADEAISRSAYVRRAALREIRRVAKKPTRDR